MKTWHEKTYWIRDSKGNKVGYLLAYTDYKSDYEKVLVGFSFCDTRFDKFDKYKAADLAEARAERLADAINVDKIIEKVPYKHREDFFWFLDTCARYFKDREFPIWFTALEVYDFNYEP